VAGRLGCRDARKREIDDGGKIQPDRSRPAEVLAELVQKFLFDRIALFAEEVQAAEGGSAKFKGGG